MVRVSLMRGPRISEAGAAYRLGAGPTSGLAPSAAVKPGAGVDLASTLGERHSAVCDQTERYEAARSVLPDATETKVFVGANTRALRHMIATGAHPAANPETRRLFVKVFEIMRRVSPVLMHDMKVVVLENGTKGVEPACPEL